jgi:GH24 family phage-related lysozyme (muramidase)
MVSGMPKINQEGLELIKSFEGCSLHAYPDPGTGAQPYTIGYGHTGPHIKLSAEITQGEAECLLKADLERFEQAVNRMVNRDLTPNQFSALVSFAFNVGEGSLEGSTILRMVNLGDFQAAANHFKNWVYAGGHTMPGLVRRREAEATLFLKK